MTIRKEQPSISNYKTQTNSFSFLFYYRKQLGRKPERKVEILPLDFRAFGSWIITSLSAIALFVPARFTQKMYDIITAAATILTWGEWKLTYMLFDDIIPILIPALAGAIFIGIMMFLSVTSRLKGTKSELKLMTYEFGKEPFQDQIGFQFNHRTLSIQSSSQHLML